MKNKDLIRHMNYCLTEIKKFEGSSNIYEVEDFVNAIEELDALIKVFVYFTHKDKAYKKIGKKVIG